MPGKGLLIAAVVLIVLGLLGLGLGALVVASEYGDRDGGPYYDEPRRYDDDGETTSAPRLRRGPGGRLAPPEGGYGTVGESIWFAGVGSDGPIPREPAYGPGMMGGCAVCHGDDGRGAAFTMMGRSFEAPDVRYSTLTAPHVEDGETEPAWSEDDIAAAVRQGVKPDGNRLRDTMPRWSISEGDFRELIEHMKRL